MKNLIYTSLILLAMATPSFAETEILLVEKSNGETIELPLEYIDEMRFKDAMDIPEDNTPDCVEIIDLGLSVNWASTNLGATLPGEPGYLLAWGELEEKDWYSWSYYKFGTSKTSLTKYTATDGINTLQSEDDAATMLWGGEWRMPTREEFQELYDNCDIDYEATEDGYPGVRLTSKVPGYEGKSIFFCAAGWIQDEYHVSDVALSTYWTNQCVNYDEIALPEFAYAAEFWREGDYAKSYHCPGTYRYLGRPIRAVTPKNKDTQENGTVSLVVEFVNGSTQKYISSDKPIATFEDDLMYIRTDMLETSFVKQHINKIYFENNAVGIQSAEEDEMTFYYNGNEVIINGKSYAVTIYDIDGKLYYQDLSLSGYNAIDISGYNPGVYIVKANNQTIKILKK